MREPNDQAQSAATEQGRDRKEADVHPAGRGVSRVAAWLAATALIAALLLAVVQRLHLAPAIGADNAYIFLAADRFHAGEGLTSIPPRAPLQPWEWRGDWAFLTQWPFGYPLLICLVRAITRAGTATAAVALSAVSCAVALVAWFAWIRAALPRRQPASLIALVGAGASFSMGNLVNPASDTVLLAATPLVFLVATWACGWRRYGEERRPVGLGRTVVLGVAAGALSWVRYAGVFVPLAIGSFLLLEWLVSRRARLRQVGVFALAAALPIVALAGVNRLCGGGVSTQEQFNLGTRVGFHLDPATFVQAWTNFTAQSLYAHRPEAKWFFAAVLPVAAIALPLAGPRTRRAARAMFSAPHFVLSVAAVAALLILLLAAGVLFHDKYDYAAEVRYYQPVRPLYFLLFVGPLLAFDSRWLRAAAWAPLVLACAWFVNQDGRRTAARWQAAPRPATEYGRWAQHFEPGSVALYRWLADQPRDHLVVFSNFHEEIALETRIPACPTPRDREQLAAWCERIQAARGATTLRILFVLDPDNAYRDYYLDPPETLRRTFHLHPVENVPPAAAPYVFECRPT